MIRALSKVSILTSKATNIYSIFSPSIKSKSSRLRAGAFWTVLLTNTQTGMYQFSSPAEQRNDRYSPVSSDTTICLHCYINCYNLVEGICGVLFCSIILAYIVFQSVSATCFQSAAHDAKHQHLPSIATMQPNSLQCVCVCVCRWSVSHQMCWRIKVQQTNLSV